MTEGRSLRLTIPIKTDELACILAGQRIVGVPCNCLDCECQAGKLPSGCSVLKNERDQADIADGHEPVAAHLEVALWNLQVPWGFNDNTFFYEEPNQVATAFAGLCSCACPCNQAF